MSALPLKKFHIPWRHTGAPPCSPKRFVTMSSRTRPRPSSNRSSAAFLADFMHKP